MTIVLPRLNSFSKENLQRFARFITLIINQIELDGISQLSVKTVKIPLKTLEREGFNYDEGLSLVRILNSDKLIVSVVNEQAKEFLKRNFQSRILEEYRELADGRKREALRSWLEKHFFSISEDDLENKFILRLYALRPVVFLEDVLSTIAANREQILSVGAVPKLGTLPIFDASRGRIVWNGVECNIPLGSHQFFLCKKLFEEKPGKLIAESDILDTIDSFHKDSPRSVYDAMLNVNKRILKCFGVSHLLKWRNNKVWIDEK